MKHHYFLLAFLVFGFSVTAPQTTEAKLKRDTEQVDLPKYCLRFQKKFEREWIRYPIQKSPVESLVYQDVQWHSGRCVIVYEYVYDGAKYLKYYETLNRDTKGLTAAEFLNTNEGKQDLEKLWHENMSHAVARVRLPRGATIFISYQPAVGDYPSIDLIFNGEEI